MERFLKIHKICWQFINEQSQWDSNWGLPLLFLFFLLFCLVLFLRQDLIMDRLFLWNAGIKIFTTTPHFFPLFYYTCLLHRPKKSSPKELYWPQNFEVIQTKLESKHPNLLLFQSAWAQQSIKLLVLAPAKTSTAIIFSSLELGRPIHPLHCFWCLNQTSCDNQWKTEIF